jgi:hypothetical protein
LSVAVGAEEEHREDAKMAQVEEERKQQPVGVRRIKRWSVETVDVVPEHQPTPPSSSPSALCWF